MKKCNCKIIEKLYRVTEKYWSTSDTDYLDTMVHLSQTIDDRLWCEIESLAALAVRKNAGVKTLIDALKVFGYEVVE